MDTIYEVICWGSIVKPRDKSIHSLGFFQDKNLAELFLENQSKELQYHWKFFHFREIKLMDDSPEIIKIMLSPNRKSRI